MKYIYTVMVTSSIYSSQNSISSFIFSRTVLNLGHSIYSVFFYGDGIFNGVTTSNMKNVHYINIEEEWKKIHDLHNVKLYLCINSLIQRGVVTKNADLGKEKNKKNISKAFSIVGFSRFLKSVKKSNRFMQF
ncbi:Sulfurtransferase TusD [Buchnera aphidicola (Anoecia corni)]|uniref:Sulfurtransferase TusD n=1 Tax=Buchnera aphidicola (Anoecia corni) TaxID=2994477 RepID=A0AAT9IHD9_9GAMM